MSKIRATGADLLLLWFLFVSLVSSVACSEEAPSRLTPEQIEKLKRTAKEEMSRICWFREGLRGEWIMPLSTTPDDDWLLMAIPAPDGGLAVKREASLDLITVATVAPDGKITRVETIPGHRTDNTPTAWPFKDENGKLLAPPDGAVLCADCGELASPPQPPPNTFDWAYLDVLGRITFRHVHQQQPFPNTLWLVREGKGLALVYAGPEKKGAVFARVDDNYRITWLDPPNSQNDVPADQADYWPFVEAGTWFADHGGQGGHLVPGMKNYNESFVLDQRSTGGGRFARSRAEIEQMKRAWRCVMVS